MAASSSQTALRGSASFMVSGSSGQVWPSAAVFAKLRKDGNNKLCDIELIVEGRKEYVHSAVLVAHSELFSRKIYDESPPFSYDLHHFSYASIRSVIDWMYFGEAKFSSDISAHFAVAAYFEVEQLQVKLMNHLIRLAREPETLPVALETCACEKAEVPPSAVALIVYYILPDTFPQPPLTTRTAKFLLGQDTCYVDNKPDLKRRAIVISLVLKWLALHRDQAEEVLEHLQIEELSEADERALITRLVSMVKNKEEVRVDVDAKNRLTVSSGLAGGPRSEDMVSRGDIGSPHDSEMELYQHMAYLPAKNMQRELAKLPDVFAQARPQTKAVRSSSCPEYILRPSGYILPTFCGHVDMNSYNEPIAAPFTAESIAEITALPDQFGHKQPSNYCIQQQQQYVTPSHNVSSVYVQPAPYGPSYTEGQPVPYLQKSQQQLPAPVVSQPGPVKLELSGGAVVIPHAAHPMLPFSQPYVEMRLPAQSSFNPEYSSSRFKTSEYAEMF